MFKFGLVKIDCGIFHLMEKYYSSKVSIAASFTMIIIVFSIIWSELTSFGEVISQTEYYESFDKVPETKNLLMFENNEKA